MRSLRTALLCVLALALVLVGCGGDSDDLGAENTQLIATTGDISIVKPEIGEVFTPESVPVELRLEGAEIIEEATTEMKPDEGHVHVQLDGETLTLLAGLEFDLVDLAGGPLEPGSHLLVVEFVAGNHAVFSPRELEQLTFLVKAKKPRAGRDGNGAPEPGPSGSTP